MDISTAKSAKKPTAMRFIEKLRENKGFDVSIELLHYTGLWPPRSDGQEKTLIRLCGAGTVFALVFVTLGCTVFHPLGALMATDDLVIVIECIGIGCLELLTASKSFLLQIGCFFFRGSKIENLTSRIARATRREMGNDPSEEKQKIVANIQWWLNGFVAMTIVVILQVELGFSVLLPAMISKRQLFGRIWFPIDPYSSPTYEILFGFFVVAIIFGVAANTCTDGMMAATLMQLVGQFRLLSHDLAHMRQDAVEIVRQRHEQQVLEDLKTSGGGQESSVAKSLERKAVELDTVAVEKKEVAEEMTRLLGECVYRYTETVRFVGETGTLFDPMLVTQIVVSVVAILSVIFFASIDPATSEDITDVVDKEKRRAEHMNFAFQYAAVVGGMFLELGFCSYMTNLITEESELVREAVYACDWLASTSSFKKSMMIVMSRANQPLYVRAAGFVPFTQETYLQIANLAFSYFTALKTVVHGKK